MDAATSDAIAACTMLGAHELHQRGSADVVFARNAALTSACAAIRQVEALRANGNPMPAIDVVLMIDDDIEFTTAQAAELVAEARKRKRACSGVYVTINEVPAASPLKKDDDGKMLWQVGLGFLAITAVELLRLETASIEYTSPSRHGGRNVKNTYREFTWSGVSGGMWKSEDFILCQRLGGVHLLPIDVGHRKTVTLRANLDTLAELSLADG